MAAVNAGGRFVGTVPISGAVTVSGTIADSNNAPFAGGGQGSQSVAAAGTPVALAAVSTLCKLVVVTARSGNTKNIAYGWSNAVRATAGTEIGGVLTPGVSVALPATDLHNLFIDATVNGEGVSYTYFN